MFEELNDASYPEAFERTDGGLCLFFKKLCPHCKNMGKVMEKFHAMQPDVDLLSIDIEENPAAAATCEALRAPTLVVIRQGRPVARKAGLMNPRELLAFYSQGC